MLILSTRPEFIPPWEARLVKIKARRYVDAKAIPQVRELVEMYQPDLMWFDTPHKLPVSEQLRVLKALREVSNEVVVNGRCARGYGRHFGDYQNTGDRAAEFPPVAGDWESIPTTNESYGYHKHDHSHKPPAHFVRLLAKAAARGGNILMNIGPMGDGRIDPKDVEIFGAVGKWLAVNGASVYGAARSPLAVQAWGESARKSNTLFLHVFDWPRDGRLVVGGVRSDAARVWFLTGLRKIPLKVSRLNDKDIAVSLPGQAPDAADSVVAIEFTGQMKTDPVRLLASSGYANVLRSFDGERYGAKLRYGDGKAPTAYVFGWSDPAEWMGWKVRVNEPGLFDVSLQYTTGSAACRGKYTLSAGGQTLTALTPLRFFGK